MQAAAWLGPDGDLPPPGDLSWGKKILQIQPDPPGLQCGARAPVAATEKGLASCIPWIPLCATAGGCSQPVPQQAQLPLTSSHPGCSNPQPTVGSWQGPHVCPWVSTIMLGPFQQGWWLLPALVPRLTLMLLVFEELPSKEERPNNQEMCGKHHHHKRVRPAGRRGQQGVSQPLLGLSQLRDRGQATGSHCCSTGSPPSGSGCCCRGAWGRPGPRRSPSGSSRGCGCR